MLLMMILYTKMVYDIDMQRIAAHEQYVKAMENYIASERQSYFILNFIVLVAIAFLVTYVWVKLTEKYKKNLK